jgi:hypothetical protein
MPKRILADAVVGLPAPCRLPHDARVEIVRNSEPRSLFGSPIPILAALPAAYGNAGGIAHLDPDGTGRIGSQSFVSSADTTRDSSRS